MIVKRTNGWEHSQPFVRLKWVYQKVLESSR